MTVRQLLAATDSRELTEWQVFLTEAASRQEAARARAQWETSIAQGG